MTSRRFESILMSLVPLNRETSKQYPEYGNKCECAVQMAIHKIEDFFRIHIKTYPSLPSNSDLVKNWSIVLAYLNFANHTAPLYAPTYPSDCKEEEDRAVRAVSSFFSIPFKDPSLGHFIGHKVRAETLEDMVYSALRKTKGS